MEKRCEMETMHHYFDYASSVSLPPEKNILCITEKYSSCSSTKWIMIVQSYEERSRMDCYLNMVCTCNTIYLQVCIIMAVLLKDRIQILPSLSGMSPYELKTAGLQECTEQSKFCIWSLFISAENFCQRYTPIQFTWKQVTQL